MDARRTAASTGSASCPGRAGAADARAACRASAGPRSTADGAYYFAHSYAAETPRATAWSEGIVAEARSGAFLGVPVPSRRRAAPRARATSTACSRRRAIPLPRLIPCLDVAAGRVVKGVTFQGLRDVGDPVELGAAYSDRGADELVFLDVKATLEERDDARRRRAPRRRAARDPVHGRRRHPLASPTRTSCSPPARTRSSVNSAALARPELITELAEKLGSQAVVVAIDTEGGRVRTRAGTTETPRGAVEWAREAEERGAGEILLTSIDADGTRAGYDLEITAAVADAVVASR